MTIGGSLYVEGTVQMSMPDYANLIASVWFAPLEFTTAVPIDQDPPYLLMVRRGECKHVIRSLRVPTEGSALEQLWEAMKEEAELTFKYG